MTGWNGQRRLQLVWDPAAHKLVTDQQERICLKFWYLFPEFSSGRDSWGDQPELSKLENWIIQPIRAQIGVTCDLPVQAKFNRSGAIRQDNPTPITWSPRGGGLAQWLDTGLGSSTLFDTGSESSSFHITFSRSQVLEGNLKLLS